MQTRPKVTLCAIVKNEAHCVTKLLDSVKDVVDNFVIVDTGSTDNTVQILKQWPSPGTSFVVHSRPWKDFGHNRSEALALARQSNPDGYTLMLDADEQLIIESNKRFETDNPADVYTLTIKLGGTVYRRRMLFSNKKPWAYKGVIHETAVCEGAVTQAHWPAWRVHSVHAGARSRDPHTYRRDAATLQAALIDEPDNSRYVFYLAQSYHDSQDWLLSKRYYTQRLGMGGWADEIWFSYYRLGLIARQQAGGLCPEAIGLLLQAHNYDPSRAEPSYALGMMYQQLKAWPLAYLFLKVAAHTPYPEGSRLFVDHEMYAWRAAMEYAVAAYYVADYKGAMAANEGLLKQGSALPESVRGQVLKNQTFCKAKVCPQKK